jgi:hypothetical protein
VGSPESLFVPVERREISTKACRLCGQRKLLTDFHRSPVSRDGRHARCRSCRNRAERERRALYQAVVARSQRLGLDSSHEQINQIGETLFTGIIHPT